MSRTLLNKEQRQNLVNRLKFTINFMISTGEDLEDIFDIRVFNIEDDSVMGCELTTKNLNKPIRLYMKSFSADEKNDYEVVFSVNNEPEYDDMIISETSLRFYVSGPCKDNDDFVETMQYIFNCVTEIEKKKQYASLESAINDLLNY